MSATSTLILEQIRTLEEQLKTSPAGEVQSIKDQLDELKRSFNTATQALTEGKSLLKG